MTDLYCEFTLSSPGVWPSVVAFIKANAAACVERGAPLLLIVTTAEFRRTLAQNRKLHKTFRLLAEHAWWDGQRYPMQFWKEYYRRRFLLKDEYKTPDGEIVQTYWSTADLSVKHFSEYLESIHADAAHEFGVEWPQ